MPPSFSSPATPFNVLSYGENVYKGYAHKFSMHAEENAIQHLPPMPRRRRLTRVDLLVIRVSKTGKLGCSKPCEHCLLEMAGRLPDKGYRVGKVFYTDREGAIAAGTVAGLWEDSAGRHVTKFYKKNQAA